MEQYFDRSDCTENRNFSNAHQPGDQGADRADLCQSDMTMTDAINAFLRQSINVEGLPFLTAQNSKEALREQAIAQLMQEHTKGEDSVRP